MPLLTLHGRIEEFALSLRRAEFVEIMRDTIAEFHQRFPQEEQATDDEDCDELAFAAE